MFYILLIFIKRFVTPAEIRSFIQLEAICSALAITLSVCFYSKEHNLKARRIFNKDTNGNRHSTAIHFCASSWHTRTANRVRVCSAWNTEWEDELNQDKYIQREYWYMGQSIDSSYQSERNFIPLQPLGLHILTSQIRSGYIIVNHWRSLFGNNSAGVTPP